MELRNSLEELADHFVNLRKTAICGVEGVGKSSLLCNMTDKAIPDEHIPTLGVDFGITMTNDTKHATKLQVWDLSGSSRYNSVTHSYYRGLSLYIIVFDITDRHSYVNVPLFLKRVNESGSPFGYQILLVGNKADLCDMRAVTQDEAEAYALDNEMFYLEFSSKYDSRKTILAKIEEIVAKLDLEESLSK